MYSIEDIVRFNEEIRGLAAAQAIVASAAPEVSITPLMVLGQGNPHDGTLRWYICGPGGYRSEPFTSHAQAWEEAVRLTKEGGV